MALKDDGIIPNFNLNDLRRLAGGPYQLRLAKPYYRHSTNVRFMMHKDCSRSFKVMGIVSRHSRNDDNNVTRYQVYHRFDDQGDFSKTLSFCTCNVGMGTSSLCAHQTASLYILYHRLEGKEIPKQHPRTDRHITEMIDLYYWKEYRKRLRNGEELSSDDGYDHDDDEDIGVESSSESAFDIGDSDIEDGDNESSDEHVETQEPNQREAYLRIWQLIKEYAGNDRRDISADWDTPSEHPSDEDVLDIDVDTESDIDDYVRARWGLVRNQEDNHNHRQD